MLQNAYSGERAAAYAYLGHGKAMTDAVEIADLKRIENEEWDHRTCLGKMLLELGSKPRRSREIVMSIIGRSISFFCLCGRYLNIFNFGWFMSMYGAGKLESGNIVEYEIAARYAKDCGYEQFVPQLLAMAEIEWDHELYFRNKALSSKWVRLIKIWPLPPSRESIAIRYQKLELKLLT